MSTSKKKINSGELKLKIQNIHNENKFSTCFHTLVDLGLVVVGPGADLAGAVVAASGR